MHNTSSALHSISIQIPSCPEAYGTDQRRPACVEAEGTWRHGDRMRWPGVWKRHSETGQGAPSGTRGGSKTTFVFTAFPFTFHLETEVEGRPYLRLAFVHFVTD